jgi:hypothetical protein
MKLITTMALTMLVLCQGIMPLAYAGAGPGDKFIRLSGNTLVEGVTTRLSVKELEQQFTLSTIDAYNPWEKRTDSYTGIWLDELVIKLARADTTAITFIALDNYQITFERAEWRAKKILLVTRIGGEHQPVRNKGPLRVVYQHFDKGSAEDGITLPKWIWMITRIEFTNSSDGD